MPNKKSEPRKVVYRDSRSGEFVKKSYADRHKSTTEREHVRTGR